MLEMMMGIVCVQVDLIHPCGFCISHMESALEL